MCVCMCPFVVSLFIIWGGNPDTEQISGGIEISDINVGQHEEGDVQDIGNEEEEEEE